MYVNNIKFINQFNIKRNWLPLVSECNPCRCIGIKSFTLLYFQAEMKRIEYNSKSVLYVQNAISILLKKLDVEHQGCTLHFLMPTNLAISLQYFVIFLSFSS